MKNFSTLTKKLRADDGITLAEVMVSLAITSTMLLGVGQIMRSSVATVSYTATQSMRTSAVQLAAKSIKNDIQDSDSFLVSPTVGSTVDPATNTYPVGGNECTTGTGVVTGNSGVVPLFTITLSSLKVNDVDYSVPAYAVGYEIRSGKEANSGELWRNVCNFVQDSATGNVSLVPTLGNSSLVIKGLAITGYSDGNGMTQSAWFYNPTNLNYFGVKCLQTSSSYTLFECPYGTSLSRAGNVNGTVNGIVVRLWDSNGGVLQDIVAARRM